MGIRNRIILTKAGLLILLGIVLIISFSGCLDSKVSAVEEINTSILLINNGEERIDRVTDDIERSSYSSAKVYLEASKVDYEEAFTILENATTDYEEEGQIIEYLKTRSSAGVDRVVFLENMIVFMEHFEKAVAYIYSEDFDSIRKELNEAEEGLNNSLVPLKSAREKMESIDMETVSVEDKSGVILIKKDLEYSEKMYLEAKDSISGYRFFVNGMEHMSNASELLENENWDKASLEFEHSSSEFAESKKIFEELTDSEFSEISIASIEIYGIITQIESPLLHFEATCKYMEVGQDYKALDEFNAGLAELGVISTI